MILKYTVEVTIEIDRKVCSNLSTSQIEPSDTVLYKNCEETYEVETCKSYFCWQQFSVRFKLMKQKKHMSTSMYVIFLDGLKFIFQNTSVSYLKKP